MNKIYAGAWILQAGRRRNMYDWLAILSLSLLLGGGTLYCIVIGWQDIAVLDLRRLFLH